MRAILWLLPGLAACASSPIEVRDSGVFQAGGRVLLRFVEPGQEGLWSGLLLDATRLEDEDGQGLAAGEHVILDDVLFAGPDQLTVDYELRQQTLAYAFGYLYPQWQLDSTFELGLALAQSKLELTSGGAQARETTTWNGVHGAVGLCWAPTIVLGFEGRASVLTDLGDLASEWRALELGARLFPRSPVALFAGWRWIGVYENRDAGSDLDLRASGPSVALRVDL